MSGAGCFDYGTYQASTTVPGKRFTVNRNGDPEDFTGATIRMRVISEDRLRVQSFDIVPSGNAFDVPSFPAPPAGDYTFEVFFAYPGEETRLYLHGPLRSVWGAPT